MAHEEPKAKLISGASHDWELVVGMEMRAQTCSRAKPFSGASTEFGAKPNSNVSLVDAATPHLMIHRIQARQADAVMRNSTQLEAGRRVLDGILKSD